MAKGEVERMRELLTSRGLFTASAKEGDPDSELAPGYPKEPGSATDSDGIPVPGCPRSAVATDPGQIGDLSTFVDSPRPSKGVDPEDAEQAFRRLVRKLEHGELCSHDAERKLADLGYGARSRRDAVDRAIRCGLLDDLRFADSYIRTKIGAGWGRQRIERELRSRDIDPNVIEGYPMRFGLDDDTAVERAIAIASRHAIPAKDPVGKLARFLIGRGFTYPVALAAAKTVCAEDSRLDSWD